MTSPQDELFLYFLKDRNGWREKDIPTDEKVRIIKANLEAQKKETVKKVFNEIGGLLHSDCRTGAKVTIEWIEYDKAKKKFLSGGEE